jgi:hypothetical protein
LVYGVAQVLQTLGLEHTSASVSGFVTGMYVVATPLFAAALLKERSRDWCGWPSPRPPLGSASCPSRACPSRRGWPPSCVGDALRLHIIGLGLWSTTSNVFGLSIVQMGVICLVCTVIGARTG